MDIIHIHLPPSPSQTADTKVRFKYMSYFSTETEEVMHKMAIALINKYQLVIGKM